MGRRDTNGYSDRRLDALFQIESFVMDSQVSLQLFHSRKEKKLVSELTTTLIGKRITGQQYFWYLEGQRQS